MPTLKLATWNAEWMNSWFTPDAEAAKFVKTFKLPGSPHVNDTEKTATRASQLVRTIDPDILAVQEGPSRPEELELFIHDYLSDGGVPRYQYFLGDSGGAQKLAVLYK